MVAARKDAGSRTREGDREKKGEHGANLEKEAHHVEREKQQGARYLNKKERASTNGVVKSRRHFGELATLDKFAKLISNILIRDHGSREP